MCCQLVLPCAFNNGDLDLTHIESNDVGDTSLAFTDASALSLQTRSLEARHILSRASTVVAV